MSLSRAFVPSERVIDSISHDYNRYSERTKSWSLYIHAGFCWSLLLYSSNVMSKTKQELVLYLISLIRIRCLYKCSTLEITLFIWVAIVCSLSLLTITVRCLVCDSPSPFSTTITLAPDNIYIQYLCILFHYFPPSSDFAVALYYL